MHVDLQSNEVVSKAGTSFYEHLEGSIEGKLIITNQRLYFKSVNPSQNTYNLEIQPSEIEDMRFLNFMKILPVGLCLVLNNGTRYPFKLRNRDEWARAIGKLWK